MGLESKVDYIAGGERILVRAHLDSQSLRISGGKKLVVPLADVRSATVVGDRLNIAAPGTRFALDLGARAAEQWRKKIVSPPSLADKLGLKPDKAVALIGALPPEVTDAAKTANAVAAAKLPKTFAADIAIVMLASGKEQALIDGAARALTAAKALWLVYEKGRAVNGDRIIALARRAGLKDTKVARVSDTHATLRFIRASGG